MSKVFWGWFTIGAMIFASVLSLIALYGDNYAEATFWLVIVVFSSQTFDRITREW